MFDTSSTNLVNGYIYLIEFLNHIMLRKYQIIDDVGYFTSASQGIHLTLEASRCKALAMLQGEFGNEATF